MQATDPKPALIVEDLYKSYKFRRVKVLQGVSLRVEQGDIFALIGPNGAGKTTLMGCLLALLRPDAGNISVFGLPPDHLDVRRVTGFLPERPSYEIWMNARQFLSFHYRLARQPAENEKAAVQEALELVELEHAATRRISAFSRGMLQRLGLAQAVIGDPKICFLDEPTSGMDPPGMDLVRHILMRLKERGCTAIVNSHHLDEVERVCNRFAFLRAGKIEAQRAVGSSESTVLILRWTGVGGTSAQSLVTMLEPLGAAVVETGHAYATFRLPSRDMSSNVIQTLVQNGVPLEEAYFEQSSLSDLFRSKENGTEAATPQ